MLGHQKLVHKPTQECIKKATNKTLKTTQTNLRCNRKIDRVQIWIYKISLYYLGTSTD